MTADVSRPIARPAAPNVAHAGLYVHVPFCLTRCGYCDFNTYAGLEHLSGRYAEALVAEACLAAGDWAGVSFVSLFLGGGTPTTLPVSALRRLLERQKEGKRRMRRVGRVDVPQEAFIAALRVDQQPAGKP